MTKNLEQVLNYVWECLIYYKECGHNLVELVELSVEKILK